MLVLICLPDLLHKYKSGVVFACGNPGLQIRKMHNNVMLVGKIVIA
jgi:hypothetical protein